MRVLSAIQHLLPGQTKPRLADIRPGLDAAADWLARAQDATPDDGVAAFYNCKKKVWGASYPETTGYIIPTLYAYADLAGREEFVDRATRMAIWECDIQLEGGGVRAGNMDAPKVVPTIFNTGQVLFGWVAAWQRTGDTRFADALRAASDWLVDALDEDGAWRRFGSPFSHAGLNVYNTRVAYGLALAGDALGEKRYGEAARANVDWALTQARPNGWFAHNDLEDDLRPLTHTIAYATRGVLEVGAIENVDDYLSKATATAGAVAGTARRDGALPGRLDADWRPATRWSCLTGNVQMAIVWLRLAELGCPAPSGVDWIESARDCIAFVQSRQDLANDNPAIRGGIAGSAPVGGHYMRHCYPNWAAHFYMDAAMQYLAADRAG